MKCKHCGQKNKSNTYLNYSGYCDECVRKLFKAEIGAEKHEKQ